MADRSLGVPTPPTLSLAPTQRLSRTRRAHGFIAVGGTTIQVHSTRRADKAAGVSVSLGSEALQFAGSMTPTQARSMARALNAAADAVDRQRGAE